MLVIDIAIPEVKIIEPQVYKDNRGYFCQLHPPKGGWITVHLKTEKN